MDNMIISAPRRIDMLILYLVMMLATQRVIEDVYIPSEIIGVIEDTLVDSNTPIPDEVHVFPVGINDVDVLI